MSYTIIETDDRLDLDVRTAEIKEYLNDRIRKNYYYNQRTREHVLEFGGLWKYFQLSTSDKKHQLFKLPSLYPAEEIPLDELNTQLNLWQKNINLPVSDKFEANDKYNWLLAIYSRSIDYTDEVGKLILAYPELLNYEGKYNINSIKNPFRVLNHFIPLVMKYYEIVMPLKNMFDRSGIAYRVRFIPYTTSAELNGNILRDHNNGLCSTHSSWHWNTPHFFYYDDENQMLNHFYDKVIEDWKQHSNLESNRAMNVDRIVQRLIPLKATDYVRRITAVGNLYPVDVMNTVLTRQGGIDTIMQIADTYYKDITHPYYNLYLKVYNNFKVLHLTDRQYTTFMALFNNMNLYYENISILTFNKIVSNEIANTALKVVDWNLNPAGGVIEDVEITLDNHSTSYARVELVKEQSVIPKELFSYCANTPDVDTISDEILLAQKTSAIDSYLKETNLGINMLNNTIRVSNVVYNAIVNFAKELESGTNKSLSIIAGTKEHMLLQCYYQEEMIITRGSNSVLPPLITKRRELNNSVYKMLCCYIIAIDKLRGTMGSLTMANYELKNDESVLFLGAEKEPAVDILKKFNTLDVKITGEGDRAVNPHKRTLFPGPVDRNLTSTIIISDIDQTKYEITEDGFDMMIDDTIKLLDMIFTWSRVGVIKINFSSTYLLNMASKRLSELTNNQYSITEFRVSGQNPYTVEGFIMFDNNNLTENTADKKYFVNSLLNYRYVNSSKDANDATAVVVSTPINYIDSIETLKTEGIPFSQVVVGTMKKEEIVNTMNAAASIMRECRTWRVSGLDSVYFMGKLDPNRISLTWRGINKLGAKNRVEDCINNGMGNSTSLQRIYIFDNMSWPTICKYANYATIEQAIGDNNDYNGRTKVNGIGGRNATEIYLIDSDIEYIITDPTIIETPELVNYKITVNRTPLDWDNITLNSNTIYLFLFVLMTDLDGDPVTDTEQKARITNIINAVKASSGNGAVVYFNYYSKALSKCYDNTNFRNNFSYQTSPPAISFGNYEPVPMLNDNEIDELAVDVKFDRLLTTIKDVSYVCQLYGVKLDTSGGSLIDVGLKTTPICRVSKI